MTTKNITLELDLAFEILLRLPTKSVLRFKSVSKSWCSIIRSQLFIEAFMAVSQPRHVLLLNNHGEDRVLFFSSPHQNFSFLSSSSMSFTKENTLKMPKFRVHCDYICNTVRSLLCCRLRDGWFVVCNPSTGQIIPIAEVKSSSYYYRVFLGYDPKSDQYKALRLTMSGRGHGLHIEHSVCTLGGQGSSHSWRPIKSNIHDYFFYENGVCIDGVVYYKCIRIEDQCKRMVGCFDVGSELLRDIETPERLSEDDLSEGYITNYLGKLAVYCSLHNGFILWVLDDVKNQIWSNTYNFPLSYESLIRSRFRFEGIAASGEIVYNEKWGHDPSELFCYNMETKMGRRVSVTGLSDYIKNRSFYSSLLFSYVDNIIYF